ncbi:polysaccharide biosynthesis protein [Achromobacter denitrificans]|nr:polysaccharide biosynthesis protein [Achromobacter denitrificans]
MVTRMSRRLIALPRKKKLLLMLVADFVALTVLFKELALAGGQDAGGEQWLLAALLTACALPLNFTCGLYSQLVRFVGPRFLRAAAYGAAALSAEAVLVVLAAPSVAIALKDVPEFFFSVFAYLALLRLGAAKFLREFRSKGGKRLRVALYGAGHAGFELASVMRASDVYQPLLFIDDNPDLHGHLVSGLRVVSAESFLASRDRLGINHVILAMPSASASRLSEIYTRLRADAIVVRTLPTLAELANNPVSTQNVREILPEDLLGRRPIVPSAELFSRCVAGRRVLVTGAGGSIGSELCRQALASSPCSLVLMDHSEYALYEIERNLRELRPDAHIVTVLGSVCLESLVSQTMARYGIDTVYHAAAYKHVPLVEANIAEGIRNNVLGASVVARCALRHGVKTCVLVSTDKAVRPTNVMGATKRASELVFQAMAATPGAETVFCMVRFGNVLGSSGSVVPLFREQLRRGGPLTVTHPDVTRYFMLIMEAAQLVIQAGAMAKGGEVFVLDMGEPVRVMDLARTMIHLSGLLERTPQHPHGDIEIKVTGLREGEKLYEELLIDAEARVSEHPRILCSNEPFLPMEELQARLQTLLCRCNESDVLSMLQALQDIVPEFSPYSSFISGKRGVQATVAAPLPIVAEPPAVLTGLETSL